MYGLIGKILRVNLTKGTVEEEYLSESIVRKYLGGRGLGTRIYMNEVDSKTDAFDPENKLILMTGPLTGTLATSGTCAAPATRPQPRPRRRKRERPKPPTATWRPCATTSSS